MRTWIIAALLVIAFCVGLIMLIGISDAELKPWVTNK